MRSYPFSLRRSQQFTPVYLEKMENTFTSHSQILPEYLLRWWIGLFGRLLMCEHTKKTQKHKEVTRQYWEHKRQVCTRGKLLSLTSEEEEEQLILCKCHPQQSSKPERWGRKQVTNGKSVSRESFLERIFFPQICAGLGTRGSRLAIYKHTVPGCQVNLSIVYKTNYLN